MIVYLTDYIKFDAAVAGFANGFEAVGQLQRGALAARALCEDGPLVKPCK